MHICDFTDRLEIENGELVRIVSAKWLNNTQEVFKEYSNGTYQVKNVYSSYWSGYRIVFSDEPDYYEREWSDCDCWLYLGTSDFKPSIEFEQFCPTFFRYVVPKYKKAKGYLTNVDVMKAFETWREHQDIEFLLALGFEQIAYSKSFYKMPKEKQMSFCKFLFENKSCNKWKVNDLYRCFNKNIPVAKYKKYVEVKENRYGIGNMSYEEYVYLEVADYLALRTYRDYKRMCKEAGHNLKDKYWLYPKNLVEAHAKVLKEVDNIRWTKEQEERKAKQKDYSKRVLPYLKFNLNIDGYHIYIPSELDDFIPQADALHQCIVYCDYQKKVNNSYCLVFIRKGNKPVATAELKKNGSKVIIGQFYAYEEKRNIKPSPKVAKALDVFIKDFKFPRGKKAV